MSWLHRKWTYPGPGNKVLKLGRFKIIYWGHCDDSRKRYRRGEGFRVLHIHRFAAYWGRLI